MFPCQLRHVAFDRLKSHTPFPSPIILLTEILPKNCLYPPKKSKFNIKGYEFHIPFFILGRGVAIYVRESLESVLVEPLTLCTIRNQFVVA